MSLENVGNYQVNNRTRHTTHNGNHLSLSIAHVLYSTRTTRSARVASSTPRSSTPNTTTLPPPTQADEKRNLKEGNKRKEPPPGSDGFAFVLHRDEAGVGAMGASGIQLGAISREGWSVFDDTFEPRFGNTTDRAELFSGRAPWVDGSSLGPAARAALQAQGHVDLYFLGCGLDFRAYEWMMEHDGQIATEASYPYLNADGYCRFSSSQPMAAKISVRECMHIRAGAVNEQKEWMDVHAAVPFSFIHFYLAFVCFII